MFKIRYLIVTLLLVVGCGGGTSHHPTQSSHQTPLGLSAHPPGWGHPPPGAHLSLPQATVGVATAQMWDTITLATIPPHPFALAGYTAGFWPTYLPLRRTWPQAHTISIAIATQYHAACLDVEPGDAVPSQVVGWVFADRAAGFAKPCIYSSFWEFVNQIRPLIAAAHIPRSWIFEWDADYIYFPRLDASFDATQWTDRAFNRNLDQSTVTLAFLSIAQPPYQIAPPLPVCYTHRISQAQCQNARNRVTGYQRAVTSSRGAYVARSCPVLAQRATWFQNKINTDHSAHGKARLAYRRGALAATRRAYNHNACVVFLNRVSFYTNLIKQTKANN